MSQHREQDPLIQAALDHPEVAEAAAGKALEAAKDPRVQAAFEHKVEEKLGITEEYKEEKKEELQGLQNKTNEDVIKVQKCLNLPGTPIQRAQQHSLIVLGIEYLISSILAFIIVKIPPLAVIINFIPFFSTFVTGVFALSCVFVQFMAPTFTHSPNNFFVFILHFFSKILLMILFSIWLQALKYYLYLILFTIVALYLLLVIKAQATKGEDSSLKVKKHFWVLCIVVGLSSVGLTLITFNGFWVWLFMFLFGLVYAFFILLALQRYKEHDFLTINFNDVYLGSVQIDADLIFSCYLIAYHWWRKDEDFGIQ